MTKNRNVTKPQGTFTPDEVVELILALRHLGDVIDTGDLYAIRMAHLAVYNTIPNTTTNTGAQTRARNIRRKRDGDPQPEATEQPSSVEEFAALPLAEQRRCLDRLERLVKQLGIEEPAAPADFDNLSDEEQIAQLRELWD